MLRAHILLWIDIAASALIWSITTHIFLLVVWRHTLLMSIWIHYHKVLFANIIYLSDILGVAKFGIQNGIWLYYFCEYENILLHSFFFKRVLTRAYRMNLLNLCAAFHWIYLCFDFNIISCEILIIKRDNQSNPIIFKKTWSYKIYAFYISNQISKIIKER